MNTIVVSGFCRCCASEGASKDLLSKYHWMGDEEVYSNMLRECFDISLYDPEDCNNSGGICEVCITQLRNAYNFKKQVILTENIFKKKLREKSAKRTFIMEGPHEEVKVEMIKEDDDSDNNMDPMEDDDDDTDYEVEIKTENAVFDEEVEVPPKRPVRASTSKSKPKDEAETSKKPRTEDDLFLCHCGLRFTKLHNKKRHLLTAHGVDSKVTTKMLCDTCGKIFYNMEYLENHLAKGCNNLRICLKCDIRFDTRSSMLEHMRQKHWIGHKPSKMKCPVCEYTLQNHFEHDKHLYEVHGIELNYHELTFDSNEDLISWKEDVEMSDGVCFLKCNSSDNRSYYSCCPKQWIGKVRIKSDRKYCPARIYIELKDGLFLVSYQSVHLCNLKDDKQDRLDVTCPKCDKEFTGFVDLNSHLMAAHDINIDCVKMEFNSFDAFLNWKKAIEKDRNVTFYKRTTNEIKRGGYRVIKSYFFCNNNKHRRGDTISKSTGTCPARITLTKEEHSEIYKVKYQGIHLGHFTLVSGITKWDRKELADRIKNGESLKGILEDAHSNANPNSRLKKLRKRDLIYIIRRYKIDKSKVNYDIERKRKNNTVSGTEKAVGADNIFGISL